MPEADTSLAPAKRRRRPALSCVQCRARKVRCDRNSPCGQCVKTKCSECTFAPLPQFSWTAGKASQLLAPGAPASVSASTTTTITSSAPSIASSPAAAHTPGSSTSVDSLLQRIKHLESELDARNEPPELKFSHVIHSARGEAGQARKPYPVRGMSHKTRFFGQSHWMNACGLVPILVRLIDRTETSKESELFRAIDSYKTLARVIKSQRIPLFVFPQIGQNLPQRQIADGLVDCYLRTFETVYRVVHIPTFRKEYEQYWESPATGKPAFVALLQLCMAIGACFYDETYTLRSAATQWIYEAQAWLTSPPEKTKMTSTGLQVMCLLRFARQVAGLGADFTWIAAGNLIRSAMYMGLHRDPKNLSIPNRTLYNCELRRRLWATILEIALQSSVDAGGPPLLSLSDFDTEPPGNFSDEDLMDGQVASGINKSRSGYSQTSVQIALLKSFPTRLAIAKHVNDLQPVTRYDETLRLNEELAAASRQLARQMAAWSRDDLGVSGVNEFQRRLTDWALTRLFLALHVLKLTQSLTDPTYYFSRKMCVDTALKLCHIANLLPTQPYCREGDFDALLRSGAGPYRQVVFQGVTIVGFELLKRKEEERAGGGLAVTLGGTEMRSVLEAALDWTLRQIRSGETNAKGHAAVQTLLAHVDGVEAGLGQEELNESIETQATAALKRCYGIMLETAGMSLDDAGGQPLDLQTDFGSFDNDPMDFLTGWEGMPNWASPDTTMSNDFAGNVDPFAGSTIGLG